MANYSTTAIKEAAKNIKNKVYSKEVLGKVKGQKVEKWEETKILGKTVKSKKLSGDYLPGTIFKEYRKKMGQVGSVNPRFTQLKRKEK